MNSLKNRCRGRLFFTRVLLAFALGILAPSDVDAQAKLSGITLSADRMNRDTVQNLVTLTGNVQVVFQDNHLSADEATINLTTKIVEARGHVVLQNAEAYAEAGRLVYNFERKTGTLYDGFVQSGQVVFEGEIVEKTGEKEYVAERAKYTACESCPPAWSFSGRRIEAEIGGYADIKYPVLRVGGYPILILPRIVVPLKSQRQSGVLSPEIEQGSASGFGLGIPYFWAISPSKDLTVTPKISQRRGLKALGEYRYVLSPRSRGQINSAWMMDDEIFREQNRNLYNSDVRGQRGFLHYRHYYLLPEDYVHRAEINYVSDLRYPRDFTEELPGHGDAALENRVSLSRNTETQHFSIEAALYQNLLATDPYADNKDAVHRFPEIRYTLTDRYLFNTPLVAGLDVNYTNFARNGFSFDDFRDANNDGIPDTDTSGAVTTVPRGDGDFDPGVDLIRTGHRLDVVPTVSLPLQIANVLDFLPTVSYRETQYRFNSDSTALGYAPSAAQRYVQADLALRTRFNRVYALSDDDKGTRLKHIIEPEVRYSDIPWIRRPDHPFFGDFEDQPYSRTFERISDLDFLGTNGVRNKIQFDYNDRVFDKRLINLALTNHVVRKRFKGSEAEYQKILTFRLDQLYDFNETERENPQPWGTINARLNLRLDNLETLTTASYFPYARVSNTSSRVRLFTQSGNFFEMSYSQLFILNAQNNDYRFDDRVENWGLGGGFRSRHLNLEGTLRYDARTFDITAWRYLATIIPPGKCWAIQLGHEKRIGNPDIRTYFNFNFQFGGG